MVANRAYIPQQGDIIDIDFNPQAGHEQGGRRPAIVVSNSVYNQMTSFVIVCPISNTDNNYPLHISIGDNMKTTGFVLCEHVKSFDFVKRKAAFREAAPRDLLIKINSILAGYFTIA